MNDLPLEDAGALRSRIALGPIGGPGSTVFPPTYPRDANSKERIHVVETCRTPDGPQQRVLIDSVASQANRQEAALATARRTGRICYPDLRVDLSATEDPRDELLGTDLPHRLADAIVRDSEVDGVAFAQSDYGRRILSATSTDLTPLLEASPLSLIFGVWFSQWQMLQPLRQRRLSTAELWAYDATLGRSVSSRLDPLGIETMDIYQAVDGPWTVDPDEAVKDKDGKAQLLKDGEKPSRLNHGNIAPAIHELGITAARYELVWAFSYAALKQLHFGGTPETRTERDAAAQGYLLALALATRVFAHEEGYSLRSRCDLLPTGPLVLELLPSPLIESNIVRHELTSADAIVLFEEARDRAAAAGFALDGSLEGRPTLVPSKHLAEMIARNRRKSESLVGRNGA